MALNAALREHRLTQREIVAHFNTLLAGRGEAQRLTTSSVNRYAQRIEDETGFLRDAREAADALVGPLKEESSNLPRAVASLLQSMAFEAVLQVREDGEQSIDDRVEAIKQLALAAQRIELASSRSADREIKIRKEARRQALEDAATAAESEAVQQGLSADQVAFIRAKILGVEVHHA